ncbi:MAG: hypothetical protein ACE10C_07570, partial [Candidatus Binatia bacterium]
MIVSIIPGNLNSAPEGKKGIFQQLLPLEAEGREGQLHRVVFTLARAAANTTASRSTDVREMVRP